MILLSENLKALRKAKNKKQADMFADLGITQARWSSYEKGIANPSLDDLARIADYFNVSETQLLRYDMSDQLPANAMIKQDVVIMATPTQKDIYKKIRSGIISATSSLQIILNSLPDE